MPLVRASRRSSLNYAAAQGSRRRRRGSSRAAGHADAATWTDVLEQPLALQRRQLIVVGLVLLAGWSSVLAMTVSALS